MIRALDRPGDLGWVIKTHGELYAREYGWDTSLEALVARIVADFAAGPDNAGPDPGREAAWIAEVDGRRAGCVFCVDGGKADGEDVAVLRLLLLTPEARGRGLGAALVDTCLSFARTAGYTRMRLWTNDPLVAARHIYLKRGFELTGSEPHHSFGADLIGQTYERPLP